MLSLTNLDAGEDGQKSSAGQETLSSGGVSLSYVGEWNFARKLVSESESERAQSNSISGGITPWTGSIDSYDYPSSLTADSCATIAQTWLGTCVDKHRNFTPEIQLMPTRILDIRSGNLGLRRAEDVETTLYAIPSRC